MGKRLAVAPREVETADDPVAGGQREDEQFPNTVALKLRDILCRKERPGSETRDRPSYHVTTVEALETGGQRAGTYWFGSLAPRHDQAQLSLRHDAPDTHEIRRYGTLHCSSDRLPIERLRGRAFDSLEELLEPCWHGSITSRRDRCRLRLVSREPAQAPVSHRVFPTPARHTHRNHRQ